MRTFHSGRPRVAPRTLIAAVFGWALLPLSTDSGASWERQFALAGVIGEVYAVAELDGAMVFAGAFGRAGDQFVENVGVWDGTHYLPMGAFDGTVYCLALHQGFLYAGGSFRTADNAVAPGVAVWDGAAWTSVGGGVDLVQSYDAIHVLHSTEDGLLAGGSFAALAGEDASGLALWNGQEWQRFGPELGGFRPTVHAFADYEGQLWIGGHFETVANPSIAGLVSWNGETALPIGALDGTVRAFHVEGDTVFVGGQFRIDELDDSDHFVGWDGETFFAVAPELRGDDPVVTGIDRHDGELVVAGSFEFAGTVHAFDIARWNGQRWSGLSGGNQGSGRIHTLARYRSFLIAGGSFNQMGGHNCYGIANWFGTWNPFGTGRGMDAPILDFGIHEGDLLAGGDFLRAGRRQSSRVSLWNGANWTDLGSGINDRVYTVSSFDGEIFAGGIFTRTSGGTQRHITRFDGVSWRSPRGGASGVVRVLHPFDGELIGGGEFLRAGGRPATRAARWNGSIWNPMAEGVDGAPWTMLTVGDDLIVGGSFTRAGSVDAGRVARWDGLRWHAMSEGMDGDVRALVQFEETVVAGGVFTHASGGQANRVARWVNDQWMPIGEGFDAPVHALAVHDGVLIAGGEFTRTGEKPAPGLAFWDGTRWNVHDFGVGGGSSTVFALESWNGQLWIGGDFDHTGDIVASNVAVWNGAVPIQVWPGDCDNDGVVDGRDLLPIGRHWMESGPSRDPADLGWMGQPVLGWDDPASAHADTDGSGRVDAEDVRAIVENWRREQTVTGSASVDVPELLGSPSQDRDQIIRELLGSLASMPGGVAGEIRAVLVAMLSQPLEFEMRALPNPFQGATTLQFTIPEDAEVTLFIFDLAGRQIQSWLPGQLPAGPHEFEWSGRDERGRKVPTGVYFLRIVAGGVAHTAQTVHLK